MKNTIAFLLITATNSVIFSQNTPPLPSGNTTIGMHLTAGQSNEVWTSANELYFNYRGNAQNTYFWDLGGATGKPILSLSKSGDGKVGLGTTSPSDHFHIFKNNPSIFLEDNFIESGTTDKGWFKIVEANGNGRLINDKGVTIFLDADNNDTDNGGNDVFQIVSNSSWFGGSLKQNFRMFGNGDAQFFGNLGVNTFPSAKLHVNGSIKFENLSSNNALNDVLAISSTGELYKKTLSGGGSSGDNLGNHVATKNLSMGNFEINSIKKLKFYYNHFIDEGSNGLWSSWGFGVGGNPTITGLDVFGDILCNNLTELSDRKIKKDINKINNPTLLLKRLNGVTYKYNQENLLERKLDNKLHYGFIAQDVLNVIPEIVSQNSNGLLSIDYNEIIPLLIETIKEQAEKIENLENRVNKLEVKK